MSDHNTGQPTDCDLRGHDFGVVIMVQGGRPVGKSWKEFCRRCGARSREAVESDQKVTKSEPGTLSQFV
ncbi:MAG: hypothetical protein QOE26_183 [Verrucomicrobiota bacterium]|jgi:hypothetical protein